MDTLLAKSGDTVPIIENPDESKEEKNEEKTNPE